MVDPMSEGVNPWIASLTGQSTEKVTGTSPATIPTMKRETSGTSDLEGTCVCILNGMTRMNVLCLLYGYACLKSEF